MNDDAEKTSYEGWIDRLIIKPDEELSMDDLRARWKFQSPAEGLVPLGFIGILWGIALLFKQEWAHGVLVIGGITVVALLVNAWQNFRAKRMTRDELIESIKFRRAIHQEDFQI